MVHIFLRTLCISGIFRNLVYSKPEEYLSRFKTQDIRYRESLKYSLHRTRCNLDIFMTYIYSSPSILRTRGIWWAVFYGTLSNTSIFRTPGIFRTLPNIYYEQFYSETLCNYSIFRGPIDSKLLSH